MGAAADDIRRAVTEVLDAGWRTGDIRDAETPADKVVGTAKMGDGGRASVALRLPGVARFLAGEGGCSIVSAAAPLTLKVVVLDLRWGVLGGEKLSQS